MFWDKYHLKPGSIYNAVVEVRVGEGNHLTFDIKQVTDLLIPGTNIWVVNK
jgi:hypothetical protein